MMTGCFTLKAVGAAFFIERAALARSIAAANLEITSALFTHASAPPFHPLAAAALVNASRDLQLALFRRREFALDSGAA